MSKVKHLVYNVMKKTEGRNDGGSRKEDGDPKDGKDLIIGLAMVTMKVKCSEKCLRQTRKKKRRLKLLIKNKK